MWISAIKTFKTLARASPCFYGVIMNFKNVLPVSCGHIGKRKYSLNPGQSDMSDGKTTVTILNQDQEVILIDSFNEFGFRLNTGYFVVGPMVVFPKTVLQWNVKNAADVEESSLSILKALSPIIDVVVISLGVKDPVVEAKVSKILTLQKISYEILPVFQGCTTFNFLNSEHRFVAGFFIPPESVTNKWQFDEDLLQEQERKAMLADEK